MCGIAGIWSNQELYSSKENIVRMTDSIKHRGPDSEGHWISDDRKIALGHRRLAIIDLSENGAQPMHYSDKYVITFNGEIYNYLEIRSELIKKGYNFKSESDTEVILASFDAWGADCLQKFDGMFAFALYDKYSKALFCARDRFGEKPFYFCFENGSLYLSSEMKAFWSLGIARKPNKSMLYNFLANDLVENPNDQKESFFEGIYKLKPSHYFLFKGEKSIDQICYWKLHTQTTSNLSFEDSSNRLRELLSTSISRRVRSDVPVGASLSGGLDSSSIVALLSKSDSPVHTLSARFPDFSKDEGYYIDLVKNQYSTQHTDVLIDENQLVVNLDDLIYHQEEPFQSGSIYAQYCIYKEARKNNLVVMLDGQGADEFLGGYDKDFKFYLRELIAEKGESKTFIERIKKNHNYDIQTTTKDIFRIKSPSLYQALAKIKHVLSPENPLGINKEFFKAFVPKNSPFREFDDLKSMLHYEMTNQGLEKLLKFADRNSMAHSVEVRLPFLCHELVEFVFSLKSEFLIFQGWSKSLLRNGLKDILPEEISYRKEKIGFEAPQELWTQSKRMNELYEEARDFMIRENIITADYQNRWKTIIAYKYITQ